LWKTAGLWKLKHLTTIVNENNDIELDPNDDRILECFSIEKENLLSILTSEITRSIKETKNNKAPGEDSIAANILKISAKKAVGKLTCLFNAIGI